MEAKARSFTFMSNEGRVTIPFFQRPYVWEETHWDDLLEDLTSSKKNHFLGSLILKQQKPKTGEPKEVLVIDGQQRLTTLSILLKALYDSFSDDIRANCKDSIRQHLFYKRNKTDKEFLIKINHSQNDAQMFSKVVQSGLDTDLNLENEADKKNKVLRCYLHFRRALEKLGDDISLSLFNSLLDGENKFLVVIDLEETDDEQSIFDTINSAGVRLSPADIIKNTLFQRFIQLSNQAEAIKIYEKTWKEVFENNDSAHFWEAERVTGRLKRDNIEILLHSIAVILGFYDPDTHTLSDLSELYKQEVANYNNAKDLEKFIDDIKKYATIYRDKILLFESDTVFAFDNYEQRLFHVLEVLEISTFHPFILFVYYTHSNDESVRKEIFSLLENFVIRRALTKMEVKSFNKLCKEFIKKVDLLKEKVAEIPDEAFTNSFKQISNKHAALILFWIEIRRRFGDKKVDLKELKFDYTLEHLMPQKWQEYWSNIPAKTSTDGTPMTVENSRIDRAEKIYWIGNMTLLRSSLNTSLRNYEYSKKMEGDGKKKGIKSYADLFVTKIDLVEPFDKGDKVWDENKIIKRTEALSSEALAIWPQIMVRVAATP